MLNVISKAVVPAPQEWKLSPHADLCRLHQLAPYIGKLKPAIARDLICRFTEPGQLILDCFSGSGTIPLEAMLMGRSVIAADRNPYAITLTRAKLEAPGSLQEGIRRIEARLHEARQRAGYNVHEVPEWVRQFFHPQTLRQALNYADACIENDDQFSLSCLLGILHHQRPGFLSYPSSHLVPYLRDKKYPRSEYPEMYEERTLEPRLLAKAHRALKDPVHLPSHVTASVLDQDIAALRLPTEVDAVITSPPYMNALDYVRDNRLRMWFLDRSTVNYSPEPTDSVEEFDSLTDAFVRNALSRLRRGGLCILVIGETVRRKRITSHPAERLLVHLNRADPLLTLEHIIEDDIPDVRRTRRSTAATKRELILVIRKSKLRRV
jgi:hypothetical protein